MKIAVIAIGALCAMAPLSASAQDLEAWGEAGGWDVMIDPTVGNGCLIQSEFEDGSEVRIGFDRTADTGYVLAFNEAWGDIEEGTTYPIHFDLDGVQYDGEATGMWLDDQPGVDISFDSMDFLMDLAQKSTMNLYSNADLVMSIDLSGSYQGLEAAIQCQDENG